MAQGKKHKKKKRSRGSGGIIALALVLLLAAGGIFFAVARMTDSPGKEPAAPAATAPAASDASPVPAVQSGTPAPTAEPVYSSDICISEVMVKNKGTVADADGEFSDWIELHNYGTEEIRLKGWYLSDKEDALYEWTLPDVTIAPDGYLLVFASGKDLNGPELHASFSLSDGETVTLSTPRQEVRSAVTVSGLEEGCALARDGEGNWAATAFATPGYANTAEGYEAFQTAQERSSPLLIWEVVVYAEKASDWVEIKNVSDQTMDLSGYYITDNLKKGEKYQPLSGTLAPGAVTAVDCTAFSLSAYADSLYLCGSDAAVCDWVYLHDVPTGGSCGRTTGSNGFYYFTAATRGAENGTAWRIVAAKPVPDVPEGVYDDAESLTVSLRGENVRYTTDGSTPTRDSAPYTGPITVSATTVIRAASFPEGQLPSGTATLSYFLRENSSLPIVSLVSDRDNLFGPKGVYSTNNLNYANENAYINKWERPASVAFFEDGGGFNIDCGIQIHGRTSRTQSARRSLKLEFKGRYGGELHYDVFGDGRVLSFSSLLLRGSLQDASSAYMADTLFAGMAIDFTPVPAQNYRYMSLFINGEYWGIYAIREHHSGNYFASHYNVKADTVECFNGEYRYRGTFDDLLRYVENNGLNGQAGWDYICQHVDMDVLIDWTILECWGGDIDVCENVRFYSSPEYKDNRVLYGLVDMDLCFNNHQTYAVGFEAWPQFHAIIPRALRYNESFRAAFLSRLGYLMQNDMSDAAILARIEAIRAQVEPEVARDQARWGYADNFFTSNLTRLINFTDGRAAEMISSARGYFGMTQAEAEQYFGSLAY